MRLNRLALLVSVGLTWFALITTPTTMSGQSLEETYDATLAAYNRTLNLLEECDEAFANFQQFFKEQRPPDGAPKEEWDKWGKAYRVWVDLYRLCVSNLKKEADGLKRKLDELEKQLDSLAGTEKKPPPRKEDDDKKKRAQDLLKKGEVDLNKWTLNVRYKIQRVNDWSREASAQVKEHGSGEVRIEPRFELRF